MGVVTNIMGIGKQLGAMRDKKRKQAGGSGGGSSSSSSPTQDANAPEGGFDSYKRGGKVKRTGLAKVHKGEEVLPVGKARRYRSRGKKR